MTFEELNYRLLQMEENLVDYALAFGWKPDVKKLWEKWLNILGTDEDIAASLLLIDLCITSFSLMTYKDPSLCSGRHKLSF
jgi:hypothetical protein